MNGANGFIATIDESIDFVELKQAALERPFFLSGFRRSAARVGWGALRASVGGEGPTGKGRWGMSGRSRVLARAVVEGESRVRA